MSTSVSTEHAFSSLPLIWLVFTLLAFQLGTWLNRTCGGNLLVSPVLIAVTLLISALHALNLDYSVYLQQGGGLVAALLGPATVALAVPLYNNARHVRKVILPLTCAVAVGGITAATSAFGLAWLLGAPDAVLNSLAVKSVTAPIAMGIAEEIGGVASLAAAFAVLTGMTGTMLSGWLLRRAGVRSLSAQGLATGVTAHGQGTARMLGVDETAGAFACVGMGLNALFTAIWLPVFMTFCR